MSMLVCAEYNGKYLTNNKIYSIFYTRIFYKPFSDYGGIKWLRQQR